MKALFSHVETYEVDLNKVKDMTKLEEILQEVAIRKHEDYGGGYSFGTLEEAAKTYANWYANKCLDEYDEFLQEYNVESDGLLYEFKMPKHD